MLQSLIGANRARGCAALLSRLLLIGGVTLSPLLAEAGSARLATKHVPAAVAQLPSVGNLPATRHLNLAISLPLRNTAELDRLLQQLYDPSSPNYHRYLTPAEFTRMFGPTEEDYQALMDFAQSNGLAVTVTHPNRVVLDVQGAQAGTRERDGFVCACVSRRI